MECEHINIGGANAIVCGNRLRKKCDFCRRGHGANQCDYPLGGKCPKCKGNGERQMTEKEHTLHTRLATIAQGWNKDDKEVASQAEAAKLLEDFVAGIKCHDCAGTGKAMCNRYFCGTDCGVRVSEKEGYCPDHMERAGKTRPMVREDCRWLESAKFEGTCLRKHCDTVIPVGERCLYFPERKRVMDVECGEEYLHVTAQPKI